MRAVLTYHSIDDSGSPISVDRSTFERQLDWLKAANVQVVPLADFLATRGGGNVVALTFDDAFRNFADIAWPILKKRALPATVFVVTEHVGGTNSWGGVKSKGIPNLPLCTWPELKTLCADGCTIGSHSMTHRHLSKLANPDIELELDGASSTILEKLGVAPTSFAYPYGDITSKELLAAVRQRFAVACTTELDFVHGMVDTHLVPRLDAYYLKSLGGLGEFGSAQFESFVRRRAFFRRVRTFFKPW